MTESSFAVQSQVALLLNVIEHFVSFLLVTTLVCRLVLISHASIN